MKTPTDCWYHPGITHRQIGVAAYFQPFLHDTVLLGAMEVGFSPYKPLGYIGRCLNHCLFSLCHAEIHMSQPLGRDPGNLILGNAMWVSIHFGILFPSPSPRTIHFDVASNMANQATSNQEPSTTKATTANTAPAHASNAGRKRRSCLMCSKRKVKCDKQKPCICCVKAGIECVFPATSSNRTEVGVTPDLVEMLQRLEKAVQTLGPRSSENTGGHGDRQSNLRQPLEPTTTLGGTVNQTDAGICAQNSRAETESVSLGHGPEAKAPSVSSSHEQGPGKIIRDHGRDTYVRRWFWDDGNVEVRSRRISR